MTDRFALGCISAVAVAALWAPVVLILAGHRADVVMLAPSVSGLLAALIVAMSQQIHRTTRDTNRRVMRIELAINGAGEQ